MELLVRPRACSSLDGCTDRPKSMPPPGCIIWHAGHMHARFPTKLQMVRPWPNTSRLAGLRRFRRRRSVREPFTDSQRSGSPSDIAACRAINPINGIGQIQTPALGQHQNVDKLPSATTGQHKQRFKTNLGFVGIPGLRPLRRDKVCLRPLSEDTGVTSHGYECSYNVTA